MSVQYPIETPHSVAILSVCVGSLPGSWPLFAEGVRRNPGYTFIVYTNELPEDLESLPDNLLLKKIQLAGFRKLVYKKLGIKLVAHSTEKILDYKPLFGYLFEESLRTYTHWGHCDLNIVPGNLSVFITDRMLNQYDKILSRGHLSIYKNIPLINRAFLHSFRINYKEILTNPVYCKFDEWHGIGILFHELRLKVYHEEMAADIYPNSFSLRCMISQNFSSQLFVMWRGRVYQLWESDGEVQKKELVYIHFQQKRFNIRLNNTAAFPELIVFTQQGAYEVDEALIHSTAIFEYASGDYTYRLNHYTEKLRMRLQPALSLAVNTRLGNLLGIRLGYQ